MSRNEKIRAFVIDAQDTERMLEDFTDEEAGKILKGLLAYANRGEEFATEDRAMRCLFKTIQANIDRNYEKYEAKCERNRQIAKKRWDKKNKGTHKEDTNECERIQTQTNGHERTRTLPNEIENENEIEITNKVIKEPKGSNIKEAKASTSETSSDAASEPHAGARNEAKPTKKEDKIDFEKVRQQFNRIMEAKKIPKLKGKIAGQRKAFFDARVRENGIVSVYRVMIKAAESNFLNGGGGKGWIANFEWIFRPNNFPKVLDGYYDNQRPPQTPTIQTYGGFRNETTSAPANGGRGNNRNEQRATEQRERIQGYAGVASKWRQIADSDAATMGNEG